MTRTVICLTLALTSLGAAPIYHAHYQGQATLISGTVTCTDSAAYDGSGDLLGHSEECASFYNLLGQFYYGEYPIYSLPFDSVLLSSEVRQWGYFDIDVFDSTLTVEPIDPFEDFRGSFADFGTATKVEGDWPFEFEDFWYGSGPSFDLLDTTLANQYPRWAREVRVSVSSGPVGHYFGGINSVTTLTRSYRIVGGAAFYSLDITYEAPIPEPATAFLFLGGAAGLLLIRRTLRASRL